MAWARATVMRKISTTRSRGAEYQQVLTSGHPGRVDIRTVLTLRTVAGLETLSGVLTVLYLLYRRALPRVIPGIPYNKDAANRIVGDVPDLLKHLKGTKGEMMTWWQEQCVKHNSPIVQVFLRPMAKPFVLVADPREEYDVLMRRTKEFDRSQFFSDVFSGTLPYHHINQKTTDKMKAQKRLLADTMAPAFLNEVAAPRIHEAMLDLVRLWTVKAKLAEGRPFPAHEDIAHATLDAIWVVTLGSEAGTLRSQAELLETLSKLEGLSEHKDSPAGFPVSPLPPAFDAVITLTNAMEPMVSSPFPKLHHWFLRMGKRYREAQMYKNQEIDTMMKEAIQKFSNEGDDSLEKHGRDRSAIDHMIRRELLSSRKENREPQYNTPVTRDEIFGFLIAGHETTATTVSWGLKLLCDNPGPQSTLRKILRETYTAATSSHSQPSAFEITTLQNPYIDAFLEEILRTAGTAAASVRCATVDTQMFGYPIPKGTDVFFLSDAGFKARSIPAGMEEGRRSASSQASKGKIGDWDEGDIAVFKPERWLKTNEKTGELEFDAKAGPMLQFGLGLRGCFGKKLAYIELRMLIVFIVWNFELSPAPHELNSYIAIDRITHQPQQCYIRVKPAQW